MITTILGYQIKQVLYQSNNSLVYRAYGAETSQPVILKMLKEPYPTPEKMAWFKREYEITRQLNPSVAGTGPALAGVVEVYHLEMEGQRPVMVLEDFGGESLTRLGLAGQLTLTNFLPLAVEMADILGQVHQRHIMHKDINPSNIILNPATGQVKLIDFGISTVLSRETPTVRNPTMLEGTLAYISPEQTGRMNRAIDYRTDFYSLGVTFYQLLANQLPFPGEDAMEVVHAHLAKAPFPLITIRPDMPQPLSDIVMKMMAKNAEDRYQSAYGLKIDLEECLHQWQATGRIDPFPLGQHDLSDRFQIPQKLYGRSREIESLLAAFEEVSASQPSPLPSEGPTVSPGQAGTVGMMLVSGDPGIGKSALIQEIYKPITGRRGYFISGKFDQLQRNIPYSSLVQAFRSLMRQLLTESEARIETWREKLLSALAPNGQVIVEVIPEVELIIGSQPPVAVLPPAEAQNRFNLVFQHFIGVFTRPEHPLVLFLDDLQWADSASLKVLQLLMTGPDTSHLFVLGAYRDKEVNETHPFMLTLAEIRQAGRTVNQIALVPLELPHITQLLADTLRSDPEKVQPLAELVQAKTHGNPFFIVEFLKSLYAGELLKFDFRQPGWQWDLGQIQARQITDNVVELMVDKAQRLGEKTQQVLKLAACIGSNFDLPTLALIHQRSPAETARDLWPALLEGLILPLGETYKLMDFDIQGLAEEVKAEYQFAHDRIQQAAYLLIPQADTQAIHWQVGHLLLQNTPPDKLDSRIFDIVNQLNLGLSQAKDQGERDELARLNLKAGQKAKASTAYQPAFDYLQRGISLLSADAWERQYDLAVALHIAVAEAAYLSGQFEQMNRWVEVVLQQAHTLLDKVAIYEVTLQAYYAQYKLPEMMQTGLMVLKLLGVEFPEKPSQMDVIIAFQETGAALAGRQIEDLIYLPEMIDPHDQAILRLLNVTTTVAALAAPELYPLLILKGVNLNLKSGNMALSAVFYAAYGLMLCGVVGQIEAGYQFGQLALNLVKQVKADKVAAHTHYIFNTFIRHWKEHVRETIKPYLDIYQRALENGDLTFAAFATFMRCFHSFWAGQELSGLDQEMTRYIQTCRELKQEILVRWNELSRQPVLALLGQTESPFSLDSEGYAETAMLSVYEQAQDQLALCYSYLNKLFLCYLFEQYPQAVKNAALAEKYIGQAIAMQTVPIFYFYDALARLALWPEVPEAEQELIMTRVAATQEKMREWARHAPENFLHRFYLVEAERTRVLGQVGEAREYYDQAIDLARQNKYLQEEALANELAARFYLARGQSRVAQHYLWDAHYSYLHWGARAKVADLEKRYAQFLAQTRPHLQITATRATTTTEQRVVSTLDLISVLKASQAISGEIELARLLKKLMGIVIENAGAERGCLILEKKGRWLIEAEGAVVEGELAVTALQAVPLLPPPTPALVDQASTEVPVSTAIINYVARTQEDVVLNEATHEGIFTQDPYVISHQPKSIFCMPLLNQGKLSGILYLENNLTTAAFTPERQEVLRLLSGQIAISVENARLYAHQVDLTNAASRFVPHEFLRFLNKESLVEVRLGDHIQMDMTVFMSDMYGFTTISERMTPQENFDFINAYFQTVAPIIQKHQGFTGKYTGDGMMAFFPQRADDAVKAAIATMQQLAWYNAQRQELGQWPIRSGIGLHSGSVILGTVGVEERMQGDVMSDTPNVASRLEGLTRIYGASIILSAETLRRIEDPTRYKLRFLGKVRVKGRQEAIPAFEVFDGDPEPLLEIKMNTIAQFEEGLSLYYDKKFTDASALFKTVLDCNPEDKAARLYLERAAYYLVHGLPADWTGTEMP